jgi:hypothetical protein
LGMDVSPISMGIGYINHGARETAGRSVGLLRPTAGAASPDPTGRRSLASRVNSRLLSHAPHVVVVGRWERAAAGPRRRARDAAHQQTTHLRRGAGPGGKTVTAPRATPATWEGADVRDHVVASVRCHSLTGFGVRSVYSTVPCPTHTFLISLLMSPGQKKNVFSRTLAVVPARHTETVLSRRACQTQVFVQCSVYLYSLQPNS